MGSQGWKRQIRKQRAIIRLNPELRAYYWREAMASLQPVIDAYTRAAWAQTLQHQPLWRMLKRST